MRDDDRHPAAVSTVSRRRLLEAIGFATPVLAGSSSLVAPARAVESTDSEYDPTVFPAMSDSPPSPGNDPFYDPPAQSELEQLAPGTILRYRDVSTRAYYILPVPADAWHVMYRTTDTHGNAVAGVTTVLVSGSVPEESEDRSLLSYHAAYDALKLECAPSQTLVDGSEKQFGVLASAMNQGWVLSVPDYEGLQSQFGAGINTGRTLLDGIRATIDFVPAGLNRQTPIGMMGFSGGGLASTWGAELHPEYAPELNVAGVAVGGVPPDPGSVARNIDGGPFAGIYFAVVAGLQRAYPNVDVDALLNEDGKQMLEDIGDMCVGGFLTEIDNPIENLDRIYGSAVANYAFEEMSDYTRVSGFLEQPIIQEIIAQNTLGQRTPETPMYIYHGIFDEIIPVDDVDELVETYRRNGVDVTYNRQFNDHFFFALSGAPGAISFLSYRLDQ